MPTIAPTLWYSREAEEAAKFYASIFPNSRVDRVTALPSDSPSGPAGSVKIVEFTLLGQPFEAFSAGPLDQFNHAISFSVRCDTQEEIDSYWKKLTEGGTEVACGWLVDRFGLSWQVVPSNLGRLMNDREPEATKRVMDAVMPMKKLDLNAMQHAHDMQPTR